MRPWVRTAAERGHGFDAVGVGGHRRTWMPSAASPLRSAFGCRAASSSRQRRTNGVEVGEAQAAPAGRPRVRRAPARGARGARGSVSTGERSTTPSGVCFSFAGPEGSMLILGPPRSGKTSSLVIPSVLDAPAAVVSTSTKPDVLAATVFRRSARGRCLRLRPERQPSRIPRRHLAVALVTTRRLRGLRDRSRHGARSGRRGASGLGADRVGPLGRAGGGPARPAPLRRRVARPGHGDTVSLGARPGPPRAPGHLGGLGTRDGVRRHGGGGPDRGP